MFATTGSRYTALTKIQELSNKLEQEKSNVLLKQALTIADQKAQITAINSSIASAKTKEILSNQVLQENKKNLDAISGSISGIVGKLKELETSKKQFATLDATKISAVRPQQPFSLGLSTTSEQLAQQTAKVEQEYSKQQAATTAFIRRRLEAERDFTNQLKAEFDRREAAQKARTVDFGKTLTAGGIFKPGSDYGNAMIAGMSRSYREIAKTQEVVLDNNNKITKSHERWANSLADLIIQYRAINYAYNLILNSIRSIPQVGIELEATKAILTSTVGSEAGMSSVLKALDEEAKRTGISITALRENFRTFQASTSLAGESLADTWTMFTNINTVSTSLHLTTAKTIGIFNALAQIFNKSKVQAEELVKQLGNLLPGAFASFQKANKDVYKSTQDLIAAMAKGTVFAHETVLNFTNFLRDRFAASFAIAATGLNANIGRMQTSFTKLGETVYGLSSGPINALVKGFTNLTNSFNESLQNGRGMLDMLDNIASVMGGVLVASMLKAISTAQMLQTSLLAVGGNAVLIALGAVVTKMQILGQNQAAIYDDAAQRLKAFKEAQQQADLGKPIDIRVEESENIRKAKKDLEALKNELISVRLARQKGAETRFTGAEGILPIGLAESKLVIAISEQKELITKAIDAQTIAIKKADQDSINNIVLGGVNLTEEMGKFQVDRIKATEGDVAAALANWDRMYNSKIEAAKLGIQRAKDLLPKLTDEEAIANLKSQIKNYEQLLSDAEYSRKLAGEKISKREESKAAKVAYKVDLEDTKALFEDYATEIASVLGQLDEKYATGLVSIKDYFSKKIELQKEDIQNTREMLEAEKAIAIARGDSAKAAQLETQIRKLNTKAIQDESKALTDQASELAKYNQKMSELRALDFQTKGEFGTAAKEKFKAENLFLYTNIQSEADAAQLQKRERQVGLAAELSQLDKEQQLSQQRYNLELDKVNTKVSAGIMGQFQAMSELTKANEDYIKVKEAEYASLQESINKAGDAAAPMEKLKAEQLNAELEKMKLSSNEFANYFSKTVGDGFADAFTEFAKGTKTAKEAFRDMAASIAQDLAKMAAQEAASSLMSGVLKPLFGSAISGLGSFFGGGFSGNGPLLSYANPFADGGVASGLSSVSGSMLTSATYFPNARVTPLASGGVVAGEAGAEAVLPLKRNKSGKLGVVLENSGQSDANVYNISVNVQSSANDTPAGTGEKIAVSIMRTIAREEISSARRSGNFKAARSM